MPTERRSSVEIIQEILKLARSGEKKTRIMYGANLSHDALNKYLAFLEARGFMTRDLKVGNFHITAEGTQFLGDLERVNRHLRDYRDL